MPPNCRSMIPAASPQLQPARTDACARPHTISPRALFVVVGGLRLSARSHGNPHVLTLFVVEVFDPKLHGVLLDAELCLFSDRQKRGVVVVLWTYAIDDAIGLQEIRTAHH